MVRRFCRLLFVLMPDVDVWSKTTIALSTGTQLESVTQFLRLGKPSDATDAVNRLRRDHSLATDPRLREYVLLPKMPCVTAVSLLVGTSCDCGIENCIVLECAGIYSCLV